MKPKALPRPGSLGAWMLAIRPKTLSAGSMPVVVGAAYGFAHFSARSREGFPHLVSPPFTLWPRVVAALVVGLGIQIGTNLVNDVADHFKGADTHERLGPPRVTNLGLLPPAAIVTGAIGSFTAAAIAGVWLLLTLQWATHVSITSAVILGLLALGCGVLYTVGPVSIAYLGLGEIFVLGFFGVFATAGTTFVMTGEWQSDAIVAGVAMGLLAVGILEANNIRDIPTDAPAGKRTLAVRLGERASRRLYAAVIAGAFVAGALAGPWWGIGLLVVIAGFPAVRSVAIVLGGAEGRELIPALQFNSLAEVAFGLALGAAVVIAS